MGAQRKIPVVLSFPYHRHKAGIASGQQMVLWTFAVSESFGIARAACFGQLAGHCQLRCLALRKDLSQSEDVEVIRRNTCYMFSAKSFSTCVQNPVFPPFFRRVHHEKAVFM